MLPPVMLYICAHTAQRYKRKGDRFAAPCYALHMHPYDAAGHVHRSRLASLFCYTYAPIRRGGICARETDLLHPVMPYICAHTARRDKRTGDRFAAPCYAILMHPYGAAGCPRASGGRLPRRFRRGYFLRVFFTRCRGFFPTQPSLYRRGSICSKISAIRSRALG